MSPRTVTTVGLTALIVSGSIASLVTSGARASKGTCGGAAVTISWRDDGVGTHITGTKRPDVIQGGPDDETIDGGAGNDVICAGDGDDQIGGGPGADRMLGEGGDDTFIPGTGDDIVDGGANSPVRSGDQPGDLVSYDKAQLDDPCDTPAETDPDNPNFPNESCSDELNAFLAETRTGPPHADGAGGHDLFTGIESLRGTRDFFNFLEGNSGPNVLIDGDKGSSLEGHEGNDLLYGRGGPDVLSGDEGDDFLDGGGDEADNGSDLLNGGDGTDTCVNANPDFVSDCEADTACPAKHAPVCTPREQVLFRFSLDGFPDAPPEPLLPSDLVSVELKTSQTKLVTDPSGGTELFAYAAEGEIAMTNTYLSEGSGFTETSVEFAPIAGAYHAVQAGMHDAERTVVFRADITSSNDFRCRTGDHGLFELTVHKRRAELEINHLRCISDNGNLFWTTRRFKSAKVSAPKPIE